MSQIVEINEEGALYLTPEQLGNVSAHTRYVLERDGDAIVLRPAPGSARWDSTAPEERAAEFRRWALSHKDGPGLPDEALSRESIYD